MAEPFPSVLATARFIDDLDAIDYPLGIKTPNKHLNQGHTKGGKFRYDRDFLLQFMSFCKDKPGSLSPRLDALHIGRSGDKGPALGSAAGRRQTGKVGPLVGKSASPGLGTSARNEGVAELAVPLKIFTRSQRGRQRPELCKSFIAAATQAAASTDADSPEIVKVKTLLNELTAEKFDGATDQIVACASESEKEQDGRTLIQVIQLVFDKAIDDASRSEMYARLCNKLMKQISQIRIAQYDGDKLLRAYLVNRCQEVFELGQSTPTAAANASEDKAITEELATKKDGEDELELYSDEYYPTLREKGQGYGLIILIGELFKLSVLREHDLHQWIKNLLGNVEDSEEGNETLCQLLTTVGRSLDTPKAKGHMNVYFSRLLEASRNEKLSSRAHNMLWDVIALRQRNWLPMRVIDAPQTTVQDRQAGTMVRKAQENDLIAISRRGEGSRGRFNHSMDDG
ncbi:hypothetical protein FRC03_002049 [Tulasnella sp. 419]|nr:hypothetical protein FRC03_002049 [Tulasnella sp. 419]